MKRLAVCLLITAACGGGNKPSTSSTMPATSTETAAQPAAPDCRAAADHMAAGDANFSGALEMRCRDNQWSDETRRCLAEKAAAECALTEEQKASIEDARAKAASGEEGRMGAKESTAGQSTPAEEPPRTRGAVKKKPAGDGKTADPCEGGE